MTLRVIGAGFGRTGTKSLQAALEELGFAPCYHMTTLFRRPWDAKIWRAATAGESVDWQAFLGGYGATVDWPGCTFYQELMVAFPEAKVLLNVREPDKWYASAAATIYGATGDIPSFARRFVPLMDNLLTMIDELIWQGTFHNRFADRDHAIAVFNAHNAAVQRTVPPARLLVYNVKEGWEPLCRFLEVPVPDKPFPHLNDAAEFQRLMSRRRLLAQLLPWTLVLGLGLVIGWWWR
jgi:hypothetical protein